MAETLAPTLASAQARIAAVRPAAYARTRHALDMQHKFVFELGWRAYFRHVWQHRGEAILSSLHEGPLPEDAYARELPADIRLGGTGVPVVDEAVRALYAIFLCCVLIAGLYGAATASRKILFVPALPAAIGLLFLMFA